ncbi:hypothetical protein [Kitasatospora sp. NPDC056531]|uniref:hypothetical protein n=1 Tax=Kitasatospora sp. NPDC056531 TaxID=3345856 RepID=UPI0036803A09
MTRLRAIVSVRLAVVLSTTGRSREALPLYQQALEISRTYGADLAEARILANMARGLVQCDQPEAGVRSARAAVAAARTTGSAAALADAHYQLGVVLDATGAPGEAVDQLCEALTLFRSQQNRLWEGYSLARLAACLLAAGRKPEAAEAAAESLAIGREADAAYCQGLASAALGEALLRLGQSAQGLACLQEAVGVFARTNLRAMPAASSPPVNRRAARRLSSQPGGHGSRFSACSAAGSSAYRTSACSRWSSSSVVVVVTAAFPGWSSVRWRGVTARSAR